MELVFLVQLLTEKILNMNKCFEPPTSKHTAQGQPERSIIFQHTKPKHKAGKRTTCFQRQLVPKNVYINQIKKTHIY